MSTTGSPGQQSPPQEPASRLFEVDVPETDLVELRRRVLATRTELRVAFRSLR